ncbi:MAG: hypothetical protein DSZ31_01915, partial [Gammaproteobacteria bacterium]
ELIELKFYLENTIEEFEKYYTYLIFAIGILFGILGFFIGRLESLNFIDLLLLIIVIFIIGAVLPQFAVNTMQKAKIFKELTILINRRLNEFQENQ